MVKNVGYDAVKFQKKTIETVYSKEELEKTRKSPWGETQKDRKFREKEYDKMDVFCKEVGKKKYFIDLYEFLNNKKSKLH